MKKSTIITGLALFFLISIGWIAYLLTIRVEPFYLTDIERREAQRFKEVEEGIQREVRESVEESMNAE